MKHSLPLLFALVAMPDVATQTCDVSFAPQGTFTGLCGMPAKCQ